MALSRDPQPSQSVVIAFADALSAPEVAWSLRDAGFRVTALERRGRASPLRYADGISIVDVTAPEESLERCWAEALDTAAAAGGIFLPLDDAALALCARVTSLEGLTLVGADPVQARLALDKREQIALAVRAGLPVPETSFVRSTEDLAGAVGAYPVVLKAADAVSDEGGRLVRGPGFVCADAGELAQAAARWGERYELLVQPLLHGVGEGMFGLRTGDGELHPSAHRRIRMMNPQGSGSSACMSAPVDAQLLAGARRFLDAVDWRGLFMLEFLRDDEGRAWFMELNGRAWGSMALALRAGLDYPTWAVRSALDESFRPRLPDPPPELVCRHLGREIVHLLFAFRGPATAAAEDWPRPLPTLARLLRVRRAERWYNWRRSDWRVFVADTIGTVTGQLRRRSS